MRFATLLFSFIGILWKVYSQDDISCHLNITTGASGGTVVTILWMPAVDRNSVSSLKSMVSYVQTNQPEVRYFIEITHRRHGLANFTVRGLVRETEYNFSVTVISKDEEANCTSNFSYSTGKDGSHSTERPSADLVPAKGDNSTKSNDCNDISTPTNLQQSSLVEDPIFILPIGVSVVVLVISLSCVAFYKCLNRRRKGKGSITPSSQRLMNQPISVESELGYSRINLGSNTSSTERQISAASRHNSHAHESTYAIIPTQSKRFPSGVRQPLSSDSSVDSASNVNVLGQKIAARTNRATFLDTLRASVDSQGYAYLSDIERLYLQAQKTPEEDVYVQLYDVKEESDIDDVEHGENGEEPPDYSLPLASSQHLSSNSHSLLSGSQHHLSADLHSYLSSPQPLLDNVHLFSSYSLPLLHNSHPSLFNSHLPSCDSHPLSSNQINNDQVFTFNFPPLSSKFRPLSPNSHPLSPNFHPLSPNSHPLFPNSHPLSHNSHPLSPNSHHLSPNSQSQSPNSHNHISNFHNLSSSSIPL